MVFWVFKTFLKTKSLAADEITQTVKRDREKERKKETHKRFILVPLTNRE
jgi:hypothetical protein